LHAADHLGYEADRADCDGVLDGGFGAIAESQEGRLREGDVVEDTFVEFARAIDGGSCL
jgi:hypothetical protein